MVAPIEYQPTSPISIILTPSNNVQQQEEARSSTRLRRRPRWMSNFEVRLPCHDDSDYILTHFSLFSDDAAKEQKW